MPKRKQDEDEHSSEQDSPLEKPKPKRKPKAKKEEAVALPDEGWETQPPSLIYRDFGVNPGKKIAAFDLDGTLTVVKSGRQFPASSKDWRFFNKKVPDVVKQYRDDGYTVVIFSNQNGIKTKLDGKAAQNVRERIQMVVAALGVPVVALMATLKDDDNRKPGRGMWDYFTAHLNGGVEPDLGSSFFVGDAAGRPGDIADSDRKFAEAIGIEFKLPEEVFGELEGKKAILPASALASTDNFNEDLTELFQKLADFFRDNNVFKARAFDKVVLALRQFPSKIDSSKYKEVSKLQGVGKGSLDIIKEWVETGKCAVLEEGTGEQLGETQKAAKAKVAASKSQAHAFL